MSFKALKRDKKGCDLKAAGDGNAWVPDPTLQLEYLVFSKQFVKVFDMTRGPKWKCRHMAWCEDKKAIGGRGSPLTWQQLGRQSQQDEGGSSAPDETLRLKRGQTCLLAKRLPRCLVLILPAIFRKTCVSVGAQFQEGTNRRVKVESTQ